MFRNPFNFGIDDLIQLLYFIPVFLITITVHEVAHGYAAYKLGDPTAKNMGRLTLNPLKHIDVIGFVMLMILRFGWAKPVPINPRNFRNPQKGMAISALAGPGANFCMATAGAILQRIILIVIINNSIYLDDGTFLYNFMFLFLDFFGYFFKL